MRARLTAEAGRLKSSARHSEAGRVLLDYAQDVEASIRTFCEGQDFAEAVRVARLYSHPEMLESTVAPALVEAADANLETIEEIAAQIDKQVNRLDELAFIKLNDPGDLLSHHSTMQLMRDAEAYVGEMDLSGVQGVDIDDSASTVAGTTFTRYTAAPTATNITRTTGGTSKTSRGRRKEARRKSGGDKKGTVWEEDYLLGSLSRTLSEKLAGLQSALSHCP